MAAVGLAPLPPSLLFATAGALLPAFFCSRPRARLVAAMCTTAGTLNECVLGNGLVAGAITFLLGAAALRLAESLPITPFRQHPTPSLTGFSHYVDLRTLPTLESAQWRHAGCRRLIDGLTTTIRQDATLQHFFQLADHSNALLEQIGWIRIADHAIHGVRSAGGVFAPFEGVVFGGRDTEVMAHELTHVLHFARVRATCTFQDLARAVAAIDADSLAAYRPTYDTVAAHLRNHTPEHEIPAAVRDAGAKLIFLIGGNRNIAHLEAIATYVQTRLPHDLRTRTGRRYLRSNQWLSRLLAPVAWAGGVLHGTEYVCEAIGFGSRHFFRRAMQLGPIDACLGPRTPDLR